MNSSPTTVDITATLNYHLPQAADVLLAVEAIPTWPTKSCSPTC